jgi:hypothetical protein
MGRWAGMQIVAQKRSAAHMPEFLEGGRIALFVAGFEGCRKAKSGWPVRIVGPNDR